MVVVSPTARPYADVIGVGVFIGELGPGRHHCGLLYKLDDGLPRFSHFSWHHRLVDETAVGPPNWLWADVDLDSMTQRIIAAGIANIGRNKENIPYGLNSSGECFDASGNFIELPLGKGLTCATFIVAVFKSLGLALIQEIGWPDRPEDIAFGLRTVALLRETHATPEHVDAVVADIGSKRFRPEEVCGAATITPSDWPVSYVSAHAIADQIVQDIHNARN